MTITEEKTVTDRAAYIDGLRQLASVLERNPEVQLPSDGRTLPLAWTFWGGDAREQMAAVARALRCAWQKEVTVEDEEFPAYFRMAGDLSGLQVQLTAYRDAVCTRVVTGTEDREVEEVVTPALTRKVTKPVEVVEWRCESLLAPAGTS
jgi:hypothetical protein